MKQGIYEQSAALVYPIGKRYAKDERAWRYAKAGYALVPGWAVLTYISSVEGGTPTGPVTIAAAALAGATAITCTAQGDVVANHYAGGYAIMKMGAANPYHVCHRIKSNTGALTGATFTVTLENPLAAALGADAIVALYESPFADVRRGASGQGGIGNPEGYGAFVGIPGIAVTADYYFWLQTWGPCVAIPNEYFGAGTDEHMAYFWRDGSIVPTTSGEATNNKPALQLAGPVLPYTGPTGSGFDMPEPLVSLQLFP